MDAAATRRYEILTGTTIIALIAGLFLVGELGLRILHRQEFGPDGSLRDLRNQTIDPETGLRLNRPNRQLGNIRINNLGFRGPDLPREKPGDTLRLAFLGSSATLDVYSPDGGSWPHLVAAAIRDAVDGCAVDYVNAGMPGFGVPEMINLYRHHVQATDPDVVVVMPGGFSAALDDVAAAQGFEVHDSTVIARLGEYSMLLQKLERGFRMISASRAAASRADKLRFEPAPLARRYRRELRDLLAVLSGPDRLVAVVSKGGKLNEAMPVDEMGRASIGLLYRRPFIYLPDLIALRRAYNGVIAKAVSGFRAVALEGIEAAPENSGYYRDRTHFNAAGSRRMAERVAAQLLASGELQELLEASACGHRRRGLPARRPPARAEPGGGNV